MKAYNNNMRIFIVVSSQKFMLIMWRNCL